MPSAKVLSGREASTFRVDEDETRPIERADEVFCPRQINAGLAADRGIHLREQRGNGIWHSDTPRRKVAAAKPVMSPTTPPPSAIIKSFRVMPAASRS